MFTFATQGMRYFRLTVTISQRNARLRLINASTHLPFRASDVLLKSLRRHFLVYYILIDSLYFSQDKFGRTLPGYHTLQTFSTTSCIKVFQSNMTKFHHPYIFITDNTFLSKEKRIYIRETSSALHAYTPPHPDTYFVCLRGQPVVLCISSSKSGSPDEEDIGLQWPEVRHQLGGPGMMGEKKGPNGHYGSFLSGVLKCCVFAQYHNSVPHVQAVNRQLQVLQVWI